MQTYAQENTNYLEVIAEETCKCIDKKMNEPGVELTPEKVNFDLMMCTIEKCIPFEKELKRDHDIDLSGGSAIAQAQTLRKLIDMEMYKECPATVKAIAEIGK